MKFEGHVVIQAPSQKVWDFFQAVDKVALCIPGCQSVELIDGRRYKALMVETVGKFRVSFAVEVSIVETSAGKFIKAGVVGVDKKLASSFRQTLQANFKELSATETEVNLTTEVSFLGKIAGLGYGLIKRKADLAMEKFSEEVRSRLEGEQRRAAGV